MFAMLIGALGVGANCIIYQQKSGKKLLLWKLISDVLWFLHYLFLKAYSGSAVALIGVFRECIFYNENKKEKKNIFYPILFILITIASAILTWKNITGIFPMCASVMSIISFWKANPKFARIIAYPISGLMLSYNIGCMSYMGIISEIMTLIATTVAIIRMSRKDEKNA